ncbi:MAG TPA: SPFH domain-containing protein [Acidisphaera sp.]|nr:SPFH domain-containing protein [Acidisphaera sp.]
MTEMKLPLPPPHGPMRARVDVVRRAIRWALIGLAAVVLVGSSYYVIEPTDLAGVRRFGTVISAVPVEPGLHFKLPLIDAVDRLQVSLSQYSLRNLTVYTVDNQWVRVGISLSYRIPRDAVFRLLYGVGRSGNLDIEANMEPIIADRALRVFARQNTVSISANREEIAGEIRRSVGDSLRQLFGLDVIDLQINSIEYSPAFTQSVEAAVRAKNDAIQAENTVNRVRYEGEQTKVRASAEAAARVSAAEGDAQAAIARARGERESAILRAEGEAQARTTVGDAEAKVAQLLGAAVAANPALVSYLQARNWNGQLPSTMLGGNATPLLPIPAPQAAPQAASSQH